MTSAYLGWACCCRSDSTVPAIENCSRNHPGFSTAKRTNAPLVATKADEPAR